MQIAREPDAFLARADFLQPVGQLDLFDRPAHGAANNIGERNDFRRRRAEACEEDSTRTCVSLKSAACESFSLKELERAGAQWQTLALDQLAVLSVDENRRLRING